jgi:hypothetical protein
MTRDVRALDETFLQEFFEDVPQPCLVQAGQAHEIGLGVPTRADSAEDSLSANVTFGHTPTLACIRYFMSSTTPQ